MCPVAILNYLGCKPSPSPNFQLRLLNIDAFCTHCWGGERSRAEQPLEVHVWEESRVEKPAKKRSKVRGLLNTSLEVDVVLRGPPSGMCSLEKGLQVPAGHRRVSLS